MSLQNAGKNNWGKGNIWIYTDSLGNRHKLQNTGYYFGWKCDMWESCWWSESKTLENGRVTTAGWALGKIAQSRKALIKVIERGISE